MPPYRARIGKGVRYSLGKCSNADVFWLYPNLSPYFGCVKNRHFIRLLCVALLLALSFSGRSQDFLSWKYKDRYFSISAGAGQATYFGELNAPKRMQPGISVYAGGMEVRLWSQVGARIEVAGYTLRGRDFLANDGSWERQRNLSFHSQNMEASLQSVLYLKPYAGDYFRRWRIDPYGALGVGLTTFNPRAYWYGREYELRTYQTEGVAYGRSTLIIPMAAGLKLRLNEFVNCQVEAAFRYTFTDYLDDVSGYYPAELSHDVRSLLSNRKNEIELVNAEAYASLVAGAPRGDPTNRDHYLFLTLKVEMFLPKLKKSFLRKP